MAQCVGCTTVDGSGRGGGRREGGAVGWEAPGSAGPGVVHPRVATQRKRTRRALPQAARSPRRSTRERLRAPGCPLRVDRSGPAPDSPRPRARTQLPRPAPLSPWAHQHAASTSTPCPSGCSGCSGCSVERSREPDGAALRAGGLGPPTPACGDSCASTAARWAP